MPDAPSPDAETPAQPEPEDKAAARKALKEQQKRELPTNDWPGKGAD